MKIYTSYFANLKNISSNIEPISICVKPPESYRGKQLKNLAPSYGILSQYKRIRDIELYKNRFYNEILNKLNPLFVYSRLSILSEGRDIVLLCYEKSNSFCHRHLVADWLSEKLNIVIEEL